MKKRLVVDIGGTDIKYGILQSDGTFLLNTSLPSHAYMGAEVMMKRLKHALTELLPQGPFDGIAISSAGVIDPIQGKVLHTTGSIANYDGFELKTYFEKAFNLPVEVNNDVNCFMLCEATYGAAKGLSDAIALTIGTGIGGAILVDYELYLGKGYSAGEWGRMQLDTFVFEEVASISALVLRAQAMIDPQLDSGKAVFDLYDTGNLKAKAVVDHFYHYLAMGIANLIFAFNPEKVVLGGGISNRGNRFIDELNAPLKTFLPKEYFEGTTLVLAAHKNLSGMLGASVHFDRAQKRRQHV